MNCISAMNKAGIFLNYKFVQKLHLTQFLSKPQPKKGGGGNSLLVPMPKLMKILTMDYAVMQYLSLKYRFIVFGYAWCNWVDIGVISTGLQ